MTNSAAEPSDLPRPDILALARDARTAGDLLAALSKRAEELGGAAYDAGWKYPIATLLSDAEHLHNWAEKLEALTAEA